MYLTDYSGTISSPLQLNVEIHIVGILLQPLLHIDLIIDINTIPFHLKRINDNFIFNSMKNDIITDIDEKYKVTFNGYIYIKIDKRQSLENVKELRIYRDLNLKSANIIHAMKE
ncbi:unnamed protein product, partial [Rotaria sordida]